MKKLAVVLGVVGLGILCSTKVFAFDVQERGAIARAAHIVDEKAAHLHEWAEARAHHGTRLEEMALEKLHKLADRARHFHEQVESWDGNDWHLRKDFYKLQNAWYRVEDTFSYLHADGPVANVYQRTRDAMYQLQALAENTRTLNPYQPRNWWEQFVHVHGPGCGHYYWRGQWRNVPPGHYEHYTIQEGPVRTEERIIVE